MAIMRWNPFREVSRFNNGYDRFLWPRSYTEDSVLGYAWVPSADVYEDKDNYVIRAELPGLTQEEIKVNVENSTLTIEGERKLEAEDNREGYQRIERSYGTFSRSFALPDIVDVVGIEAKMEKGVLTVTLPKREEVKPKQIEVHVA